MTAQPLATAAGERRELPAWMWLWLPVAGIVGLLAVRVYDGAVYRRVFDGELGAIELATPAVLMLAVGAGLDALRRARATPVPWLRGWILCVTAGCLYFAGEELSWGQHLFGWGTPDYLERLNDQGETNLHNISSWLDQKPRLLLELWVLVGGVVLAWRRRHRPRRSDRVADWFWPGFVCFPAALLAILIRLPERVKDLTGIGPLPLELRWSEPQELYFGVFLLMYLASIRARLRAAGA